MQHVRGHVTFNFWENANAGHTQTTIIWMGEIFSAEMQRQARIANETYYVRNLREMGRQRAAGRRRR
jgi:hypothetical protein